MFYKGIKEIGNCFTPATKQWSNGLAIKADTYKSCTNFCTYCFARALTEGMMNRSGVKYNANLARVMNVRGVAKQFEKAINTSKEEEFFLDWAIKTKRYVEFGTMAEVFQEDDLNTRVTWNFLQILRAYKMPMLINTKGNLLIKNKDYFNLLISHPAPVVVSITLVTSDDGLSRKIEPRAPLPSERLALAKSLTEKGIVVEFYLAPFLLDFSDIYLEKTIKDMIDTGASGVHIRTFYVNGSLNNVPFWKEYVKKHIDKFEGGRSRKWKSSLILEYYEKIQKIALEFNSGFDVVGVKKSWFEANPFYGKLNVDKLPEKFKEPIEDFTAIPILRKIRENIDKPQLLLWDKIGYKKDKIDYPRRIKINEGGAPYLKVGECTTCSISRNYILDGFKWLRAGLWSGFDIEKNPSGFLTTVKRIYPVKINDDFLKMSDDPQDFALAYVPPELNSEFVKEGCVDYEKIKSCLVPEREGGVEDKFIGL